MIEHRMTIAKLEAERDNLEKKLAEQAALIWSYEDGHERVRAERDKLKALLKRSHANELNRWTVGHTHVEDEYDPGCEVCTALQEAKP